MNKSTVISAEQKFSTIINECLAKKKWTPTTLYIQSNCNKETFTSRALYQWLSGERLPKLEATIAMSEALKMPELVDKRVELERERYIKESRLC